jgi:hypothetical protein
LLIGAVVMLWKLEVLAINNENGQKLILRRFFYDKEKVAPIRQSLRGRGHGLLVDHTLVEETSN